MAGAHQGTRAVIGARVAVAAGLLGVAVTQPVLDLFGRNPTFFTAGPYGNRQIVAFALVVAVVPILLVGTVLGLATLAGRRAGRQTYVIVVALLGALLGNVVVRGIGGDGSLTAAGAAVAGAAAVLWVEATRPGRLLLQYLAVGNGLFLVAFLVVSPTARLLSVGSSDDLGTVVVPPLPGPVVVVVLDELPLATLLRVDGTINADRYPRFAELAERSTWFRNASSQQSDTHVAVPSLLTGVLAADDQLPNYEDHPRNLFTLLADAGPIERYEPITSLCPSALCDPPPAAPLTQALEDAGVVYGHRVLPPSLRDDLPEIGTSWGGFGGALGDAPLVAAVPEGFVADPFLKYIGLPAEEKAPWGQAAVLAERTQAIEAEPGLHLVHVTFPHHPWMLSAAGTRLYEAQPQIDGAADPDDGWRARQQYQLHSMQVGAADVAIGNLIDHLDEAGIWDDTTLVVVSDHGIGLTAPDFGRTPTPANAQELFRVPFFVHGPGLDEGAVVDDPALVIDLLPTLVDLLDIETDWTFDGHSLLDGSVATVVPRVGHDVAPLLEVVRGHAADFPRGDGWLALASVGEHADLVGRPLADLSVGTPSPWRWTADHEDDLGDLPTASGQAPLLLTGVVDTSGGNPPPELLVAVNGTVVGVAGGYAADGGGWRFTAYLGNAVVDGANQIDLYEVAAGDDGPVLRALG